MRKTLLSLATVGALAVAGPAAALDFGPQCGFASNGTVVCASASATFLGNVMTVDVTNLQGQGVDFGGTHRITGFAFYYAGSGNGSATLNTALSEAAWTNGVPSNFFNTGAGAGNTPGAGYSLFAGASVSNSQGGLFGCTPVGNANGESTCPPAQPGRFVFDLGPNAVVPQTLYFAFRSQTVGPDGEGSEKCFPTATSNVNPADDHSCSVVVTSTVPEPATVALMASGLLGLLGVGAVRRRQA